MWYDRTMSIGARTRDRGADEHIRVDNLVSLKDNTSEELAEAGAEGDDEELDPELERVLDEAQAALRRGERGRLLSEVLAELRAGYCDDEALSDASGGKG